MAKANPCVDDSDSSPSRMDELVRLLFDPSDPKRLEDLSKKWLPGWISKSGVPRDEANDISQDGIAAFIVKAESDETCRTSRYLCAIVKKRIAEYRRRQYRSRIVYEHQLSADYAEADSGCPLERQADKMLVRNGLDRRVVELQETSLDAQWAVNVTRDEDNKFGSDITSLLIDFLTVAQDVSSRDEAFTECAHWMRECLPGGPKASQRKVRRVKAWLKRNPKMAKRLGVDIAALTTIEGRPGARKAVKQKASAAKGKLLRHSKAAKLPGANVAALTAIASKQERAVTQPLAAPPSDAGGAAAAPNGARKDGNES